MRRRAGPGPPALFESANHSLRPSVQSLAPDLLTATRRIPGDAGEFLRMESHFFAPKRSQVISELFAGGGERRVPFWGMMSGCFENLEVESQRLAEVVRPNKPLRGRATSFFRF